MNELVGLKENERVFKPIGLSYLKKEKCSF